MEIYYWFLFFGIMIFISFFNWVELFGFFIVTIMVFGGVLNYELYNTSNNWFFQGLIYLIDFIKNILYLVQIMWQDFTTKHIIGNYILRFIVYLENTYQQIKTQIKTQIEKEISKQVMSGFMGNMSSFPGFAESRGFTSSYSTNARTVLRGTPRLSIDDDETDDEN